MQPNPPSSAQAPADSMTNEQLQADLWALEKAAIRFQLLAGRFRGCKDNPDREHKLSIFECEGFEKESREAFARVNAHIARLTAALAQANDDAERIDAMERGLFRVSPDGMDGWTVRARGTLGGIRDGYINHGAHRLREALDAARLSPEEQKR